MKTVLIKLSVLLLFVVAPVSIKAQEFQGKAYYSSKTTMDMSRFNRGGRQMSEQQKKQMEARMKSWLEKTYILTFNKEESIFKEDEKLEAPVGGRGPSVWGSSFSSGPQYKNIKTKTFIQDQEFFGKQFLIKEEMKPYSWIMGSESKQIGKYTTFKATVIIPADQVNWMRTLPRRRNDSENKESETDTSNKEEIEKEPEMVEVVAWYTPMIPISQGPSEYWGLPGLILELNAGNTVMLCSKIVMNPNEKEEIKMPEKGKEVTKKEYNKIITEKMQEFRNNRGRRGDGRRR